MEYQIVTISPRHPKGFAQFTEMTEEQAYYHFGNYCAAIPQCPPGTSVSLQKVLGVYGRGGMTTDTYALEIAVSWMPGQKGVGV